MPMLFHWVRAVLLLAAFALFPGFAARADGARSALVMGNSNYAFAPLANPSHDANDIAQALRKAGFGVEIVLDADMRRMREAIAQFGTMLGQHKGVGFFYYAGHGVQIAGENYLVPTDAAIDSEVRLKESTVNASTAVDAMAASGVSLNIVVLDACRNNPLVPEGFRGLSRMDSSDRLFVSFSTRPGAVALDGDGRNSPYAKHLVQAIGMPRLNLENVFKQTLKGVYKDTQGQQSPWISSSYFDEFVFLPGSAGPALASDNPAQPPRKLTGVYRADGINPGGLRYRGITAVNLRDGRIHFKWWIAKQVFDGTGELAGKMLVVEWGQKHPVMYTLDKNGFLNGEWADSKASERLELFASAAPEARSLTEGRYAVTGRNPDGSSYNGTVAISKNASGTYRFDWKVGNNEYRGDGELEDGIVTVHWGNSEPVVYALRGKNRLKGLWSNGGGEETLSLEE